MHKSLTWAAGIIAVVAIGLFVWSSYFRHSVVAQPAVVSDYKNAAYLIGEQRIQLKGGVAEMEAAPGSTSKIVTRYFGNELRTDLDGDGREDVAFIITQQTGGTGVFYYAVGALDTGLGYAGSEGYLLGDRIAPQMTEVSQNPRHKNVVVFNYAVRASSEPFSAAPSISTSVYLKLDPKSMRWGVVEPDFSGESPSGIRGVAMLGPTCPVMRNPPDPQCADKPFKTSLVITSADQSKVIKTVSTDAKGAFTAELPPGEYSIRSAASANILPYCRSNGTIQVKANAYIEITVSCDTGIR
jgi:hypothetical protein